MARITLIGPNQLASNPRLVRNADALVAAGHDVTVVYPDHLARFRAHDAALIASARWRVRPVDFCTTPRARLHARYARVRRRAAAARGAQALSNFRLERAYGYFGPELAAAATATRPELLLAQQQMTVIPAARSAAAVGARFAVDIEDLIADCADEPVDLVQQIERRFFSGAAFLATMSEAAADRIAEIHSPARRPIVLHNCMSLAERVGLSPPEVRSATDPIRLYWFGQTIGAHACAEAILQALPHLGRSARLTMRGANPLPHYVAKLYELAASLGLRDALHIEPGAPPADMVRLAGKHDICFGTQPGRQLFHQLAIGNKVFTGMMAGCATALTDTLAHRKLVAARGGWAFMIGDNDPVLLASELNRLILDPARLAAQRRCAWDLAAATFNWESESLGLISAVSSALNVT
jgi:glycosyltransferase involved in cell wall biosynthesis